MSIFKRSVCLLLVFSVCLSVFVFSVSAETNLDYPLSMDNAVSSSWNNLTDYMSGSDRWGKFQPLSSSTSFSASYQLNDDYHQLFPDFVSGSSYTISVNYAVTIPNTSYNTVNPSTFATKTFFSVVMQNGTNFRVYPTVNYTRWNDGTGWTVRNTFSIPEGAKSVYSITFGCTFNSSFPTSQFLYMTVYPFQLKTVTDVDKQMANDDKNTEKIGGWISQAVSNLISGIMDILMDVFCPSLEYIQGFINDIDDFLVDHLGFLYYPFHVIVEILNSILEFNPTATPSIMLPSLIVPVGEERYTLWEDTAYTFDIINTEPFKTVHQLYLAAVDCSLAFGLIMLFRKKLDEVMTR